MAALHDQLVHFGQQFRAHEGDIVHDRLQLVLVVVPGFRVAEELSQCLVLVHQLMEAIKVAAQTLLDHAHHQDAPHLHSRPSGLPADAGEDVLVEKRKQSLAELRIGIEVLKPDQEGRDVIPGFGIQPDLLDADLAEHVLRIAYLSHAAS